MLRRALLTRRARDELRATLETPASSLPRPMPLSMLAVDALKGLPSVDSLFGDSIRDLAVVAGAFGGGKCCVRLKSYVPMLV